MKRETCETPPPRTGLTTPRPATSWTVRYKSTGASAPAPAAAAAMSMSSSTPAPVIRPKTSILDKSLSRGKQEVSLTAFALLFSEMVQYCQTRSNTVPELQQKLHDLGFQA